MSDNVFTFHQWLIDLFTKPSIMLVDGTMCEKGHVMCSGLKVPANRGGCKMDTWGDVG